jgi:hypothetical protein
VRRYLAGGCHGHRGGCTSEPCLGLQQRDRARRARRNQQGATAMAAPESHPARGLPNMRAEKVWSV